MQRNSQTSQTGHCERTRMCTMQTARAVEDPDIHAEIQRCIPMQTSCQIAPQPLTLQARPTCSRCVTVVSSDWRKLFKILPSIRQKLWRTLTKNSFYCKEQCINTDWKMVKKSFHQSLFVVYNLLLVVQAASNLQCLSLYLVKKFVWTSQSARVQNAKF